MLSEARKNAILIKLAEDQAFTFRDRSQERGPSSNFAPLTQVTSNRNTRFGLLEGRLGSPATTNVGVAGFAAARSNPGKLMQLATPGDIATRRRNFVGSDGAFAPGMVPGKVTY